MIGRAALGIWMTIDPAKGADFNAWYPRQHLPERLSVPGFLRGRRYAAVDAALPYFTLYELAAPEVATSEAYLERLNAPTDWTRRVLPTITTFVRNAYRGLATSAGDAAAGHLLTVRVKPDSGRGPYVREWLERDAVAEVAAVGGGAGVGTYLSEGAGTSLMTEERRIMGGEVLAAPPLLALCEVSDTAAAPALREFWQAWARKIAAEVTLDFYRLMYGRGWLGERERQP